MAEGANKHFKIYEKETFKITNITEKYCAL